MTPDIVVDIGNSRMKWGLIHRGKIVDTATLPIFDQHQWIHQCVVVWGMDFSSNKWAISSVVPESLQHLWEWLQLRKNRPPPVVIDNKTLLRDSAKQFGFTTEVEHPSKIGTDRLLTALAARQRTSAGSTTVAINVGTAMTVDFVKEDGTHVGGAILPGPFLMAKSLHDYTAKLPQIEIDPVIPVRVWGANTKDAIELWSGTKSITLILIRENQTNYTR